MAVKRTSGVSPIISSIDRRVKTVESAQTTLSAQYANAVTVTVADDDNPDNLDPDLTSGADKKYEYKRVLKAYIYGDKVTGAGSRCELYFGENPEIAPEDPVDVQGVHGTSTDNFNISPKQFKVLATDTPPWTDPDYRGEDSEGQTRKSWRNTPTVGNNGDTITNTVWFNPVVEVPSTYSRTSGRELVTTRRIDTVEIVGSTVTVNLNSTHKFELGDIISVDLPQPAFGVDGIFRISEVPDTSTIVYELDSPLGSPVTLTSTDFAGGAAYVYPVARRFVKDGTVWVDKSVEPNRVWVWNVLRWYDTAESPLSQVPGADSIAPSPVQNLTAESAVQAIPTAEVAGKATITLTWDPPTTNENGTPITDLGGYSVWWRYSLTDKWRIVEIDDPATTTWFGENFTYNVTVLLAVYAKDKGGNRSTAATTSILTSATPAQEIGLPSAPSVSGYLGTMKVYWNGLNANGSAITPTSGVFEVLLHISKTNNFTPSSSTLYERFPAINGPTYTVIPGNAILDGGPIVDGQTYYFKFIFLDVWGNQTASSAQGSFIGKISNIVSYDMIDVGTLTGQTIVGLDIRTDNNPSATDGSGGGIVLNQAGLTAYNAAGVQTFNISAANGAILIGSSAPATQADIGNFIDGSEVNGFVTSITNTTITTPTLTGGTIQTTSTPGRGIKITNSNLVAYNTSGVETFRVEGSTGSVYIRSGMTIGDVETVQTDLNGVKTNIYVPGTTEINGGRIRTGTVLADKLESDLVLSSLIRTNPAGTPRIEIRGANNIAGLAPGIISFKDSSGNTSFRFYSNGLSYLDDVTVAGTLNVTGTISGGSVVGSTFRTRASTSTDKRVIISGNTHRIAFYADGDSDTSPQGSIEDFGTQGLQLQAKSQIQFRIGALGSPTSVAFINSSGMGFNSTAGRWQGQLKGSATAIFETGGANTVTMGNDGSFNRSVAAGVDTRYALWTSGGNLVVGASTGSDERLKENIEPLQHGLSFINELNPVQFNYINPSTPLDAGTNFGVIAQQLKATLIDRGVQEDNGIVYRPILEGVPEEYYTVNYSQMIAPLIKAVQELSAKNDALEARLAALEGNG